MPPLVVKSELKRLDDVQLIAKKRVFATPKEINAYLKEHKIGTNYGQKALNETLKKENLSEDDVKALDLYNRKAQDISPTLTEPHHNSLRLYDKANIRRLTPTECERLQGFPDKWTEGQSDTQRYKQMGNAITVDVAQAIFEKLYKSSG